MFSIAIPTYNRPESLRACLLSIREQTLLPVEVIVIDDGDLDDAVVSELREKFSEKHIDFVYKKKDHSVVRKGLSESKNLALSIARQPILFFTDDDCVLDAHYCEHIMQGFQDKSGDDLIGVGGVIKNSRTKAQYEGIFNTLFLLGPAKGVWDVTSTGFQVWDDTVPRPIRGYYMHGGVSAVRVVAATSIGFRTFLGGRTALEDVDFSFRAKREGFHSVIVPAARVLHMHAPEGREDLYITGLKESLNRREIFKLVKRKGILLRLLFIWNMAGWIIKQLISLQLQKGLGMIVGSVIKI